MAQLSPTKVIRAKGVGSPRSEPDSLGVDELVAKLVTLEDQLASLKLQQKVRSSRPHHHQRSRSRSKSRRRYNPQGKYCYSYYHLRFGKKCLPGKCVQPCSFNESGNESQQLTPRQVLLPKF
ncbi:hypothetical protein TNCV_65341 [Trichonephila clavipes]|nr:hypothetical protein TNCV_65341 [Trichonephila clavipes]